MKEPEVKDSNMSEGFINIGLEDTTELEKEKEMQETSVKP